MRQDLYIRYAMFLSVAVLALPAWRAFTAEGDTFTLTVQGVLATRGDKKTVAPSLGAFADVLKRFPYDKFEDIGKASGVVQAGKTTSIKVGSHTIDATLVEAEKGTAKIRYTVKDGKDNAIGTDAMAMAPGQIVPVQVGEPAFPIILLFQIGK